jgi:ATP-dependent Clp protease ATP-binding subunit ClpB
MRRKLLEELRQTFRPEFLNRIDDIIVFNKLGKEHLGRIIELQLGYLRKLLADKKIEIEISDAAKDLLLREGYDEQFGARPLKRAIQRLIQDPLALAILNGDFGEGDVVEVDRGGDQASMKFSKKPQMAPMATA